MLELFLIRHGRTDWNVERRVMGMEPISLNEEGRDQVARIAEFIAAAPIESIYTSPALRTRETADILARNGECPVVETAAFQEIDYGEWVGESFTYFEGTSYFYDYMFRPSSFQIPGGEHVGAAQQRAVAGVETIRQQYATGRVAVVSHADVIKAIVVHYLHLDLDLWQQYKIDNASLTILRLYKRRVELTALNVHPQGDHLFDPPRLYIDKHENH